MLHVSVDEKPDEWLNNIFLLNTMGIKWFTYTYRIVVGTIFSLLSTFSDYTLKIDLWENVFPPKVFIDEQKHFFFIFLSSRKLDIEMRKVNFLRKSSSRTDFFRYAWVVLVPHTHLYGISIFLIFFSSVKNWKWN